MPSSAVVDLFAGPGGWDLAAAHLGLDPLGIEWDDAACATREAAGLRTVQGDVAALDPADYAPCEGLIASPPCQAFSMAGNGAGRRALSAYGTALRRMGGGFAGDVYAELDAACDDPRAHLVLEPLRWALALEPRWVAIEQVEPVLPLWEEIAVALAARGYSTWAGVLSAERYGVPQTRKRAILLASLDRTVGEPPASHQRYVPPRRGAVQEESLFAAPEPERIVLREEEQLEPWVSMAEALGWGMTARPYPVIAGGTGGEKVGGSAARAGLYAERDAGRWAGTFRSFGHRTLSGAHEDGEWVPEPSGLVVEYRRGGERLEESTSADAPAPAVTSRTDRWQIKPDDEARHPWVHERPSTTLTGTQRSEDGGTIRAPNAHRGVEADGRVRDEAPRDADWPEKRPATTVAGDPRIAQPGHKRDELNPDCPGTMEGAIRVSLAEALVLQSFPPDYPVAGTKTKQFEQVGNAVPPLLALAALKAVL